MSRYYLFLIGLLIIPFISANLVVSPVNSDISVFRGQNVVFSLDVWNNNSFRIYNFSFSNLSDFSFPFIDSLEPDENRVVSYSVLTNDLFTSLFVSSISFYYTTDYNLSPRTFYVNITDGGFFPNNLSIMENDSIVWTNLLSNDSNLRDLSSGFPDFVVPFGMSVNTTFPSVHSYLFYEFPRGFTGSLNVVSRSNIVFAHDSSLDVPVTFLLRSSLNPSTLQLNLLTFNFTSNDNQSQFGVLEVKNAENIPLYNIFLNDSRGWVQFAVNNFTLDPLQNRLINFNVTPKVYQTSLTNVTLTDGIWASSLNGGNASADLLIRINYKNFDVLNVNGTQYILNVLGVNETISACLQHMDDVGFESCQLLRNAFRTNETVIREVPAVLTVSEDQAKAGWASVANVEQGFQRVENLYNRLYDSVQSYTDLANNNSKAELARDERQLAFEDETNRALHNRFVWEMTFVVAIVLLFLIHLLSIILELSEEFRLMVATLQE